MTNKSSNRRKRRLATMRSTKSRLINLAAATAAAASLAVGPTPTHAIHAECNDNDDYRTSKDLQCSQHVLCEGDGIKRAYGYDDVDILMLKYNCPETCGLCKDRPKASSTSGATSAVAVDKNALGGTMRGGGGGLRVNNNDNNNYGGGTATRESNLNRRPGLRPPPSSESTYNRYTIIDGHQELTQSCRAGFHPYCQDDEYYYSKLGLPCWFHVTQNEDCSVWLGAGYTREDVFELITYCPCSCGVQCGEATMPPTSAPTEMPSPNPSAYPTISASPTERPSPSPSAAPSSSPSALPTARPSSSPSFAPTSSPTASPSSHPSAFPSHSPTSSPTPKPSDGPTRSPTDPPTKAPARAPTQMPTRDPTRQPTTSRPTSRPTSSPTRTEVVPAPVPAQGQARVRLPPTARPSVPVVEEDTIDEEVFDLLRQDNDNQEKEMECPEAITGLIPATPDCKFAIHCSRGTKTFGPIPCPNEGVFDIRSQNCVERTPTFVCQWNLFQPKGDSIDSASVADPSRKTPAPTLAPITSAPTALPSRTPTLSPVSSSPTRAPTTSAPSAAPIMATSLSSNEEEEEALVSLKPFVEDIVDISEEEEVSARTSFVGGDVDDGDVDDEVNLPTEAPAEQSFWKTGLNPSTGKIFTLQVVAIAAIAGVLIIVLAVAMFSLGRRMNKNSKDRKNGAQTRIRPGDKVLIHNIPSIDDDKGDEENGFVAAFLKTFKTKDDDSTIQTRPSMKSTRSGNSMLKSSHEAPPQQANQTLQTIQVARQLSKEVTEKQLKPAIKAAVQQVEVAASNSRESLQDATVQTAQDFNHCGDRMFQCAARALCLPNDVNATCGSTRNLQRGSKRQDRGSDRSRSSRSRSSRSRSSRSSDRRRRHHSSSRRHNREYSGDSTYEDI